MGFFFKRSPRIELEWPRTRCLTDTQRFCLVLPLDYSNLDQASIANAIGELGHGRLSSGLLPILPPKLDEDDLSSNLALIVSGSERVAHHGQDDLTAPNSEPLTTRAAAGPVLGDAPRIRLPRANPRVRRWRVVSASRVPQSPRPTPRPPKRVLLSDRAAPGSHALHSGLLVGRCRVFSGWCRVPMAERR